MPAFAAEFHARSAFSFLRGASLPEIMVWKTASLGYEAIAITDHLGFYGSARAHGTTKELAEKEKRHIHAIVGTTLEFPDGHIPVLCATRDGYRSLSQHLTDHHLSSSTDHSSRITRHFKGLIALTGDREGPVCRALLRNDKTAALAATNELIRLFGQENLYVELTRHGFRDDARLIRQLVDLASHLKLPILACNAPLHAGRQDRMLADAFTCLRHHTTLDQAGDLLFANGERHLKSPAEMARLFADLPQALLNTHRLKDRIEFSLTDLGYEFPNQWENGRVLSHDEQTRRLRHLAHSEIKRRGVWHPELEEQIDREIEVIHQLKFPGYFLIVRDIMDFARSRGIFCQGRGSAANSSLCYALQITHFDPVKNHLLFERFLSDKTKSDDWPDIDIDFPSGEKREEVIQYVLNTYGPRHAAMTANVIRYRSKSAFREMSKILGFPPTIADRFSTHGHSWHGEEKDDDSPQEAEFENRISSLVPPSHPRFKALKHLYHAVLEMPRHLGQHSGGIIICDQGLDTIVPIQPAAMPNRRIVQWDKDDCDDLGIVKIDLLGLGFLAALEDAISICSRNGQRPIDLDQDIPLDDPEVYDLLGRADTIGTFQVESRAQMATLPIMKPGEFYDVAIEVAIIRPGPIVGGLMHPYLNRRRGLDTIEYLVPEDHPAYKKFVANLERTNGVPMFQEQMIRMTMDIAGYSGAEADGIRRAVSFKRNNTRIVGEIEKLRARMTERGVPADIQDRIVQSIQSFALYGFPESHALSFAWIAYVSCWMKVHHPAAFYCGLINNQPMGFYSVHTLIQDARHHGIRVLPVSCVHSVDPTEFIDEKTIRLGLHRLKGIRPSLRQRLVEERQKEAFSSLTDFLERVRPNLKERRILAESGALNDFPEKLHRRAALWQSELPLHDDLLSPSARPSPLPPMTLHERISSDIAILGTTSGFHPMKLWRRNAPVKILRARDLHHLPAKIPVTVGGLVICRQRPGTAKGHCFISLEDETGIANLFVKKELFEANRMLINHEPFLMAEGRLQISQGDQPTVFVTALHILPATDANHASESHDFH
jgi:error-prone DNA polymerase